MNAVAVEPSSLTSRALRATPNPSRAAQALEFTLPTASPVRVTIHDGAGRLVRAFEPGVLAAGPHRLAWNGLGESGARLAPGVFFVTLETGTERRHAKVLRLGQ